ncbi:TRAP transporter permease [Desulfovibrio sp. OttesenSCG-928-O18]|nr:TRAP transporter permease [Desulfovibrio sp. OttesenSCG-928-O18]
MSDTSIAEQEKLELLSEEGYSSRKPQGAFKTIFWTIGIVMALFHIWFLGYSAMEPWELYYFHLGFGLVLAFMLYPFSKKSNRKLPTLVDMALIALSIACCFYFITGLNAEDELNSIIYRIGVSPTPADIFFSVSIIVLALEMTRRTNGWILPSIALFFIAYALLGQYLPQGFGGHRGVSFERLASYLTGMDAMLSTPLATSASFVFLFFLFSSFLASSGAGQFFIDLAMGVAGSSRGGPAKVAVIGSALFGTISGNSAANVVASGTFTIPMMIKVGYSPRFAAAVEAVASTGGQMTPPILGAAAFIIAEITGTPYLDVALATVIPALLYFTSIFYMIDLEAYKKGLKGYSRSELPNAKAILLEKGHLILPIFVLIFVLVGLKASVIKAAIWAIYSSVICTFLRRSTWLTPEKFIGGFADGAKQAVGLISACATAGIIIGVLNMTGMGLKFAGGVIALSGSFLPIALVLTMASALVLGMGLPTAAAYLICAAVIAPALTGLNVPPLVAHLFIFYFACLSAITPPVALAAFTAAFLAKAKPMGVAVTAVRLGIIAFIVPYMFVYAPSLLWQGGMPVILGTLVTSLIGVFILGSAIQGAFRDHPLNALQRVLFLVASLTLIQPGLITDLVGAGLFIIAAGWQWMDIRKHRAVSA